MKIANPFRWWKDGDMWRKKQFFEQNVHFATGEPTHTEKRNIRRAGLLNKCREIVLRRSMDRPRLLAGSAAKRRRGEVSI